MKVTYSLKDLPKVEIENATIQIINIGTEDKPVLKIMGRTDVDVTTYATFDASVLQSITIK